MGSSGGGNVIIPQMSASCPTAKDEQRTGDQGFMGKMGVALGVVTS